MTPTEVVLVVDPRGYWLGDGTGPDNTPAACELRAARAERRAPRPVYARHVWNVEFPTRTPRKEPRR